MIIENIYTTDLIALSETPGTVIYCDNIFPVTQITQVNEFADQVIENIFNQNNLTIENIFTQNIIENYFPTTGIYIEDVYTTTLGSGSATDISFIETELQISGSVLRFVEFTYTGDNVSAKKVYTNSSKTTQLYDVVYNYTGDNLTSMDITRVSDSFSYTKTFTYLSDNLISINYA